MPIIISLIIRKGGIGKTHSSVNIAVGLANSGFNTLLIDNDPQGNASMLLKSKDTENYSTVHFYTDSRCGIKNTHIPNLSIVSADRRLAKLENELTIAKNNNALKTAINGLNYDYIIIDNPPSLGMLSINSLIASDYVIIPVTPTEFAYEGLSEVADMISVLKEYNTNLKVMGVLITQMAGVGNVYKEAKEQLMGLDTMLFKTVISKSTKIPECEKKGLSIFEHSPRSIVAKQYAALVKEVVERGHI